MVFTDEKGNDVGDTDLRNEIIALRDEKASCIFFVVIETGDNVPWEQTFGDIGTVIQINDEFQINQVSESPSQKQAKVEEAMKKILDGTKACSVCHNKACSGSTRSSSGSASRTPKQEEWTTILRRKGYGNSADYFNRSAEEYKQGFGNENEEFFIGLDNLVDMTSSGSWMLEVTLVNEEDNDPEKEHTATYDTFKVSGDKYELIIGGYESSSNMTNKLVNGTQWDFKVKKKSLKIRKKINYRQF